MYIVIEKRYLKRGCDYFIFKLLRSPPTLAPLADRRHERYRIDVVIYAENTAGGHHRVVAVSWPPAAAVCNIILYAKYGSTTVVYYMVMQDDVHNNIIILSIYTLVYGYLTRTVCLVIIYLFFLHRFRRTHYEKRLLTLEVTQVYPMSARRDAVFVALCPRCTLRTCSVVVYRVRAMFYIAWVRLNRRVYIISVRIAGSIPRVTGEWHTTSTESSW